MARGFENWPSPPPSDPQTFCGTLSSEAPPPQPPSGAATAHLGQFQQVTTIQFHACALITGSTELKPTSRLLDSQTLSMPRICVPAAESAKA